MDRRRRIAALAVAVLAFGAVLGFQAATANPLPGKHVEGTYPGNTLITVQSFGWFDNVNGEALIVTPDGNVVWRFDPPQSRVFDAEALPRGRVLVSLATWVPVEDCPREYRDAGARGDHCVRNRVVEVDRDTGRIVWQYAWYDAFVDWHEPHDADRLPSGRTAIADMGNDRVFTVNRAKKITWSWSLVDHLGPGSQFWERHVPEDDAAAYRKQGPEDDWTHVNDVDRLRNGNVQLSVRNFDVIVEVDRRSGRIVDVLGTPGNYTIMREQHDPNRIEHAGTVLVADSENNRVRELDAETGAVVWSYVGTERRLQWPRDADRLPNGNTLIADSRNFRVLEVNETGTVVWSHSLAERRGIVYDVDRLGIPEEPDDVPSGRSFSRVDGPDDSALEYAASFARFVLPSWVGGIELVSVLGFGVASLLLAADVAALLAADRR